MRGFEKIMKHMAIQELNAMPGKHRKGLRDVENDRRENRVEKEAKRL